MYNKKLNDIINAHSQWLRSKGEKGSCADFSGLDLRGVNFNNKNLSYANFSNSNLQRADLTKIKLISANLTGAHLEYANLSKANITSANLTGAHLEYANLSGVNFTNTDLSKVQANHASLNASKFKNSIFSKGNFNHCIFNFAKIEDSIATDSMFKNCSFLGATLKNNILNNADFSNSTLNLISSVGTSFEESILNGTVIFSKSNKILTKLPDLQNNIIFKLKNRFKDQEIRLFETYEKSLSVLARIQKNISFFLFLIFFILIIKILQEFYSFLPSKISSTFLNPIEYRVILIIIISGIFIHPLLSILRIYLSSSLFKRAHDYIAQESEEGDNFKSRREIK